MITTLGLLVSTGFDTMYDILRAHCQGLHKAERMNLLREKKKAKSVYTNVLQLLSEAQNLVVCFL